MTKKIRLLFLFIGLLFVSSALFLLFQKQEKKATPISLESIQPVPEKPSLDQEKITLQTTKGPVTIKNIFRSSKGELSLGGIIVEKNDYYYIAYYPQDQGFIISMTNKDIITARQKAEKDFLEILGVNQEDACKLRLSLTVPKDINFQAAGGDYGLSFCPNGTPFPTASN